MIRGIVNWPFALIPALPLPTERLVEAPNQLAHQCAPSTAGRCFLKGLQHWLATPAQQVMASGKAAVTSDFNNDGSGSISGSAEVGYHEALITRGTDEGHCLAWEKGQKFRVCNALERAWNSSLSS